MSEQVQYGPRPSGWERPVAVPETLDELQGSLTGVVRLPLRIHSSGFGPDEPFDLSDERQRVAVYQIVLTHGDLADIRRYVQGSELRRVWLALWLPPHVRRAWNRHFSAPATV